jgi:hypothetical protein
MDYETHQARFLARIAAEDRIALEIERCASIMRAVGLELVSHRGDRDGHIVELRCNGRVTRGFGLTVCAAFEAAAQEHRS